MNKEQIYKSIVEYVNTLNENDQKTINRAVEAEQIMNNGVSVFILSDILTGLKADIRADCAKANGSTNSFKSAMDIIKAIKKQQPNKPGMHGAWMVDEKQYVCDGYRAIRFNEPLDLPAIPKDTLPINVKQLFDDAERNVNNDYPVPSIGDLKAHIALEKAKRTERSRKGYKPEYKYDAGEAYPLVNAEYLLNMITALDDCKIQYGNPIQPLYCTGKNGEGLLLPMRRKPVEQNDGEETA